MSKNAVCCTVILICLLTAACLAKYSGGNGTAEEPYLIGTPNDLNAIGTDPNDWDKHFLMTADVNLADFNESNYQIIGTNWYNPFTGSFDGNGHAISNFKYASTDKNFFGLFGYVAGPNCIFKNVHITNFDITICYGGLYDPDHELNRAGCLAGEMHNAEILNCSVSNSVIRLGGGKTVGGLIGYFDAGLISNCNASEVEIWCEPARETEFAGGIAGFASGVIEGCSATGRIYGDGYSGGIIGSLGNDSEAIGCLSEVEIHNGGGGVFSWVHRNSIVKYCAAVGTDVIGSGGLIAKCFKDTLVYRSYSTKNVFNTYNYGQAGGLIGDNEGGIVIECFALGSVEGYFAGGLVGENTISYFPAPQKEGRIRNCYAFGSVSSFYNGIVTGPTGGLVGRNYGSVANCYSTGHIGTGRRESGLIGRSETGSTVTNSFWDKETSGVNSGSPGLGRTTAQMQTQSTFTDAGWDFVGETINGHNDIWRMCVDGVNYPKLSWEFLGHGDLTCPDGVDFIDYSVLANEWRLERLEQDYNSDGRVNFKDWAIFANNWEGSYIELPPFLACWLARSAGIADIAPVAGDDFVDWQDLAILTEHWLDDR